MGYKGDSRVTIYPNSLLTIAYDKNIIHYDKQSCQTDKNNCHTEALYDTEESFKGTQGRAEC